MGRYDRELVDGKVINKVRNAPAGQVPFRLGMQRGAMMYKL